MVGQIRHPGARCECQATRHALVINCSNCGRIVCEREAGDYCLFCGFWLNAQYAGALSEAERRAEIHKQKLLLFDRESEKRTRVYDDQADYFSTDNEAWLDPAELASRRKARAEAEAARQRQRTTLTVTFDFAGRQVVAQTDDANRAALEKRFGVEERPDVAAADAQLERRLAAELDEVERAKQLSAAAGASSGASAAAPAGAWAQARTDAATPAPAGAVPVQRITPSGNIAMRPMALPRATSTTGEPAAPAAPPMSKKQKKAAAKAAAAARELQKAAPKAPAPHKPPPKVQSGADDALQFL